MEAPTTGCSPPPHSRLFVEISTSLIYFLYFIIITERLLTKFFHFYFYCVNYFWFGVLFQSHKRAVALRSPMRQGLDPSTSYTYRPVSNLFFPL